MSDLVCDNYFYQMVVAPTCHQNLLDLVFTNQPVGVQIVDNLPLTDHDAVWFTLNVVIPPQTSCKRSLFNYKKADLSLLCDSYSLSCFLRALVMLWNLGSCLKICLCPLSTCLYFVCNGEGRN